MEEKKKELGPIEVPTLTVKPASGPLQGRTLVMRFPSTRYWIARARGEDDNETFYAEILDAIEEHDLGRDPASLMPSLVIAIGHAWLDALREVAVPPQTGNS